MATANDETFPIFLTTKQASHLIGCSTKYLQNMVGGKRGPPHYRLKNKTGYNVRLRFKKSDLLKWMESNRS